LNCLCAKTWIRKYTYPAGEADSKLTSRAIALEQVKRLLLQEIGVYVQSTVLSGEFEASGEVKDLSAKQIEIISAGITETKIIEEDWNGETYYIKAEITADENEVINRLDKVIDDKEKTKQLEESRRKTDDALAEIERLKQLLAKTKVEDEKLQIQNTYNQSSNQLTAEDWFQKGYNADEMEEYDNAILYYQKAIAIDPDDATAYNNMGVAYYSKGWETSAADNLYQAGLIFLKQNSRQDVLKTIDAMKDMVPDSPLTQKLQDKLYE
jgi:tetratricopeptide (TPR) repeat protein